MSGEKAPRGGGGENNISRRGKGRGSRTSMGDERFGDPSISPTTKQGKRGEEGKA